MKSLSHTAEGKMFQTDPGAWAFYIACKYNPRKNDQIVQIMTDEQRQALRDAYDHDKKMEG